MTQNLLENVVLMWRPDRRDDLQSFPTDWATLRVTKINSADQLLSFPVGEERQKFDRGKELVIRTEPRRNLRPLIVDEVIRQIPEALE